MNGPNVCEQYWSYKMIDLAGVHAEGSAIALSSFLIS